VQCGTHRAVAVGATEDDGDLRGPLLQHPGQHQRRHVLTERGGETDDARRQGEDLLDAALEEGRHQRAQPPQQIDVGRVELGADVGEVVLVALRVGEAVRRHHEDPVAGAHLREAVRDPPAVLQPERPIAVAGRLHHVLGEGEMVGPDRAADASAGEHALEHADRDAGPRRLIPGHGDQDDRSGRHRYTSRRAGRVLTAAAERRTRRAQQLASGVPTARRQRRWRFRSAGTVHRVKTRHPPRRATTSPGQIVEGARLVG
jgi:hypothetical protein